MRHQYGIKNHDNKQKDPHANKNLKKQKHPYRIANASEMTPDELIGAIREKIQKTL